ncbi:MAG: ImmA/IrrE family metallo-endopeptidase [Planctomycetaceae bacterium]|jgi:Zn-dependent peptidase ImmA (M78 family)|nr:ImmA/IrrE family metallo-endopeptidase [Planctomycetaceae bacterium]
MCANAADFRKAKMLAFNVLEANMIIEPPVVAQTIAKTYGLRVDYSLFNEEYRDEVAGFLDIDEKMIVVNAEDSRQRQNFTVAHELGHFLLEHDVLSPEYTYLFRHPEKQKNVPMEQEANIFAANLLVPTSFLREYLERYSFATDEQLSRIFGVSATVIKYRRLYI